jgi:alkylhydroperoxidase family enzyme
LQDKDSAATVDALMAGQSEQAELDDAHRELLAFAKQLTLAPAQTSDEDVAGLRSVGWTDNQIAEAVYVISLFAFFNRLADGFGLIGEDFRLA